MRRLLSVLVIALLVAACQGESALQQRIAAVAPKPTPRPRSKPTRRPPPPVSTSLLTVAGDIHIDDHDPDVVAKPATAVEAPPGRRGRWHVEVRHRVKGSSQPDSVLVFFNVPAAPGTYALHSPEDPPLAGRVYAFFTTRGEALGSMKDFNTAVAGTLTLRDAGADVLVGSFDLAAQEPPPPPPPAPLPGQAPPKPVVGNKPTAPPARVQASGSLLALLPPAAPTETAQPPRNPGAPY